MTTSHDTFREQLLDLAYGELSRREARALKKHLEGCPGCRAELERMTATRSAMSALEPLPAPERGEAILLAAAREAARARAPKPFLPGWLWGASIGAVAVAVVAALSLELYGGGPPVPSLRPEPRELVGSAPAPAAEPATGEKAADEAGQPRAVAEAQAEASRDEGLVAKRPAPAKSAAGPGALRRSDEAKPAAKGALEPSGQAAGELAPGGTGKDSSTARPGAGEPKADARFAAPPPPAAAAPAAPPPADDADREAEARAAAEADGAFAMDELKQKKEVGPAPAAAQAPAPAAAKSATPRPRAAALAAEDPISRHARLRVAGALQTATRTFAGCPGEAERVVESDPAGAVVKVTRRGTAAGRPYQLEQFYGEDGALGAVRYQAEGQVHELRLGPGGAAAEGIPPSALEPRQASQARADAPPRCDG